MAESRKLRNKQTGAIRVQYRQPDGSWGDTDPDAARPATPTPAPAPSSSGGPSMLETAARRFGQGLSLGLGDEMSSLLFASGDVTPRRHRGGVNAPAMTPMESREAAYDDLQRSQAQDLAADVQHNPGTARASELAGNLVSGIALSPLGAGAMSRVAPLAKNATALEKAAAATVVGVPAAVGAGALTGAGQAEPGQRMEGAKSGGAAGFVGGLLAGPLSLAASGLKNAGQGIWNHLQSGAGTDAPLYAKAAQAGAQPKVIAAGGIDPTPEMKADTLAARQTGHLGSDLAFDRAAQATVKAAGQKLRQLPGLDDAASAGVRTVATKIASAPSADDAADAALRVLETEAAGVTSLAKQAVDTAINSYPNTRLSMAPLRQRLNMLIVRGQGDVTGAARKLADERAASIVDLPGGDPALYPSEVDLAGSGVGTFREAAKQLLRRLDDEELEGLSIGSPSEVAEAGIEGAGPSMDRYRIARLTVAEAVEQRRIFDEAANAASRLAKGDEASGFAELATAVRGMLPERVRIASDNAHRAFNQLEARLHRYGLPPNVRSFESARALGQVAGGPQWSAIRNRLRSPDMAGELPGLLGPERYSAYVEAEKTLARFGLEPGVRDIPPERLVQVQEAIKGRLSSGALDSEMESLLGDKYKPYVVAERVLSTLGLPPHTRAIDPAQEVALTASVRNRLTQDPVSLRPVLEALDPQAASAQRHAVGSKATEAIRGGTGEMDAAMGRVSGMAYTNPFAMAIRAVGRQGLPRASAALRTADPLKFRPVPLVGGTALAQEQLKEPRP